MCQQLQHHDSAGHHGKDQRSSGCSRERTVRLGASVQTSQDSQEAQEEVQQTPLICSYAVRSGSEGKIS